MILYASFLTVFKMIYYIYTWWWNTGRGCSIQCNWY